MPQFYLKRGDLLRSIRFDLLNPDGTAVDLTAAASVRFLMRARSSGTVTVNAAASIVSPEIDGTVQYDWQSGDTATAGTFDGEFEVTWPSSKPETFPNAGFIEIIISGDIA